MAVNGTYQPIATYSVTGSNLLGTTGVTFSSIPQTYTDLIVVQSTKVTAPAIALLRMGNGSVDTSASYSNTIMSGAGSYDQSARNSGQNAHTSILAHQTNEWAQYVTHFQNYSSTNMFKSTYHRYSNTAYGGLDVAAASWASTSAINIIQLYLDRAESYVIGSTFTLYGIKAA